MQTPLLSGEISSQSDMDIVGVGDTFNHDITLNPWATLTPLGVYCCWRELLDLKLWDSLCSISYCSREQSCWVQSRIPYFYWLAVRSTQVPFTFFPAFSFCVFSLDFSVHFSYIHLTPVPTFGGWDKKRTLSLSRQGAEYACTKRARAGIKPLLGRQVWESSFAAVCFLECHQWAFVTVVGIIGSRFLSLLFFLIFFTFIFLESSCCSKFCVICILTLSSWQSWMKSRSRSYSTRWEKSSWGAGGKGKKKPEWRRLCWERQQGATRVRFLSSFYASQLGMVGLQLAVAQQASGRDCKDECQLSPWAKWQSGTAKATCSCSLYHQTGPLFWEYLSGGVRGIVLKCLFQSGVTADVLSVVTDVSWPSFSSTSKAFFKITWHPYSRSGKCLCCCSFLTWHEAFPSGCSRK